MKPGKLKSINNISIVWVEEASEVKYEGFKELIGRLRHPTLSLHMILSTNPVDEGNWTFKHFFKNEQEDYFKLDDEELYERRTIVVGDTYYHHSTADDNLFLPESYIAQLDEMIEYDADLHRVARKGRFGVNGIRVLPQFEVMDHQEMLLMMTESGKLIERNGMDFGFVTSYNALIRMKIDPQKSILYIYYEYYKNGMTDDETAEELEHLKRVFIKADAAEPKTIFYYQRQGFRMKAAKKFPGSRLQYTKKVKRFKRIICSSECKNTIRELKDLTFKVDKNGKVIEDEFNIDSHCLSAIWYGLDDIELKTLKHGKG